MNVLAVAGNQRVLAEFQEQVRGQDVEVVETATSPDDCLAAARRAVAEVAVVHVSIGDYLDLVRRLADDFPTMAVLVMAPISGAAALLPLVLEAGAAGLVIEGDTPASTLQILTRVHAAQQKRLQAILAAHGARAGGRAGASDEAEVSPGKLVLVARAKGGAGATFVAANLAGLWLAQQRVNALLIDLAVPFGGLPIAVNAAQKSRHSIDALIPVLAELDRAKIERLLLPSPTGLRVLGLPSESDEVDRLGADHITAVLQCCRREFAYTIVDAPLHPRSLLYAAARQADAVMLVSTAELASLAATVRLAGHLQEHLDLRPGRDVHLVVNQMDQHAPLTRKEIEERVRWTPLAYLPRNLPLVSALVQSGALVPAASKEPLYGALRDLGAGLWQMLQAGSGLAATAAGAPAQVTALAEATA